MTTQNNDFTPKKKTVQVEFSEQKSDKKASKASSIGRSSIGKMGGLKKIQ